VKLSPCTLVFEQGQCNFVFFTFTALIQKQFCPAYLLIHSGISVMLWYEECRLQHYFVIYICRNKWNYYVLLLQRLFL